MRVLVALALCLVPLGARGFESECRPDDSASLPRHSPAMGQSICSEVGLFSKPASCGDGLGFARGAQLGEHAFLARQAMRWAGIPTALLDDDSFLRYYVDGENVPGTSTLSLEPAGPGRMALAVNGKADAGTLRRKLTLAELANVADGSHSLADFISGNEHCLMTPSLQRPHVGALGLSALPRRRRLPEHAHRRRGLGDDPRLALGGLRLRRCPQSRPGPGGRRPLPARLQRPQPERRPRRRLAGRGGPLQRHRAGREPRRGSRAAADQHPVQADDDLPDARLSAGLRRGAEAGDQRQSPLPRGQRVGRFGDRCLHPGGRERPLLEHAGHQLLDGARRRAKRGRPLRRAQFPGTNLDRHPPRHRRSPGRPRPPHQGQGAAAHPSALALPHRDRPDGSPDADARGAGAEGHRPRPADGDRPWRRRHPAGVSRQQALADGGLAHAFSYRHAIQIPYEPDGGESWADAARRTALAACLRGGEPIQPAQAYVFDAQPPAVNPLDWGISGERATCGLVDEAQHWFHYSVSNNGPWTFTVNTVTHSQYPFKGDASQLELALFSGPSCEGAPIATTSAPTHYGSDGVPDRIQLANITLLDFCLRVRPIHRTLRTAYSYELTFF